MLPDHPCLAAPDEDLGNHSANRCRNLRPSTTTQTMSCPKMQVCGMCHCPLTLLQTGRHGRASMAVQFENRVSRARDPYLSTMQKLLRTALHDLGLTRRACLRTDR